jgi:hypothetical protein
VELAGSSLNALWLVARIVTVFVVGGIMDCVCYSCSGSWCTMRWGFHGGGY